MALKDELLREFSLHPMTVINGEELASRYHVSRAAVWKAVKALKSEGFDIVSSPSGYTFTENNDSLVPYHLAARSSLLRPQDFQEAWCRM